MTTLNKNNSNKGEKKNFPPKTTRNINCSVDIRIYCEIIVGTSSSSNSSSSSFIVPFIPHPPLNN